MLNELIVKNIVLIKNLSIDLKPGLSVLTGETGAGKSILLDSIGLILGNRVDFTLIRKGTSEACVIGIFKIEENHPVISSLDKYGISFNSELIIRREIKIDGKSKCFVNDTLVTRNALIEIADFLIEVQGQFEDRGLLNANTHLLLLDSFANHNNLIENTKKSYECMRILKESIKETEINVKKINEDNNWIKESLDELVILDPKFGEEDELDKNKKFLINHEKIFNAIGQSKEIIEQENGLEDLNNQINKIIDSIKIYDRRNINEALEKINIIKVEIEDLKNIIKSENLEMNENDQNLEVIEDRLHSLRSHARKHDCKVNDLIEVKKDLESKLEKISNEKESLEDLYKEYQNAIDTFVSKSTLLSNNRKKYAEILTNKINLELPHLKLENANIEIKFEELNIENASNTGIDKVIFLATTNYGADMLPINKIASGGELSRFLLAVKVVLESVIHNRTIIFDEIDSGIGGATANAVGSRLAKLGKKYQTLVVTHSPQVTSKGHHHYIVQKDTTNSITTTNVSKLNENQRVEEVARMVSGNIITAEAREAASKLLDTK